jgi:hypothetical protein
MISSNIGVLNKVDFIRYFFDLMRTTKADEHHHHATRVLYTTKYSSSNAKLVLKLIFWKHTGKGIPFTGALSAV